MHKRMQNPTMCKKWYIEQKNKPFSKIQFQKMLIYSGGKQLFDTLQIL